MTNRGTKRRTTGNLTVRLPEESIERLRVLAESEYRSVNQEVRRLIEARLAEAHDDDEPLREAA